MSCHPSENPAKPTEGQRAIVALGKQHGSALVVPDPAGIFTATIGEMGSQQGIHVIVGQRALQRDEANPLQDDVPVRIGKDFFLDPVAPLQFGVSQLVNRNTRFNGHIFKLAVPFFFGEKTGAVGDNQSLIPFRMPWLSVNHTRLCRLRAVPTPLLALEVQRAEIPGQPGAKRSAEPLLTSVPYGPWT